MKQRFENLGMVLSKADAKRIVGANGGASGCINQCIQDTSRCNFFHYCDSLYPPVEGKKPCDQNPSFCCEIYCNSELPY